MTTTLTERAPKYRIAADATMAYTRTLAHRLTCGSVAGDATTARVTFADRALSGRRACRHCLPHGVELLPPARNYRRR